MRIYTNCHELMSEITREVLEMGIEVHPHSMQNKVVKGDRNFATLEITNYTYMLTSLKEEDYLFIGDSRSKEWVRQEFSERIDPSQPNPGKAYKIREELWEKFLNDEGKFDYSYSERLNWNNNLNRLIIEAINNPDSRQLILPVFHPTDVIHIGGFRRVPCTLLYHFLVRNGKVDIIYDQRSADVYTHFGNDVWQAWALMVYFASKTGFEPGALYHNIGSLHVYYKDIENLRVCIKKRL